MSRVFLNWALILLALALAIHAYEPAMDVDMSHDFLEVDPLQNEYAQLAEHGIAFTELGAEVEVGVDAEAEAEVEAEAGVEAEAEVDAEAEVEVDAEAEAEVEAETEVEAEAELPAGSTVSAPIPGVPVTEVPIPPAVLALPANSYRIVSAQEADDMAKAEKLKKKYEEEARLAMGKSSVKTVNPTGWAFRERGAPESVNVTDVYALAYERLKTKLWSTANITQKYPIREYTYVILPGSSASKTIGGDLNNVKTALKAWYGVPEKNIVAPVLDYSKAPEFNAGVLFSSVNNTYWNVLPEQKIVYVTNSNGVLPVHAMLERYPEAATQIQGVIALNPIWGGSHLGTDFTSLTKEDAKALETKLGVSTNAAQHVTFANRQTAVRTTPLDYNGLRVMVVATHKHHVKETDKGVQSLIKYVLGRSKEINDGVVALSDQIIPGGRAIILDGLTHGELAKTSKPSDAVDTLLAAQSILYTFFKVTP